ncbi:hypothetical protein DEA8626_03906 [Defluviimonas aquaemixtae]|uniref:DUF2270 domain-containing protein n=1 Tax=Albidovulum aquaemixtae TaxID=1542388 RepID=A0A2R8BNC5_9RHOB|nr:DUF2270 domain-containing protein [Defluviimonas aquaemixtae]SPH24872.1 hypothetical protein DEA8626_03906 [Defluviimonas aquaemixtae]
MSEKRHAAELEEFSPAEIGALAHLYRAEVYRSTIWRTRLDTTSNWAVVTLGVALSITFSAPDASPIPLLLVGILIFLFLALEARRYRYFNVWRARARWLERFFYVPMLRDGDLHTETDWQKILADDYFYPRYHVSYLVAVARRVRNNYLWILLIQTAAYIGKLLVHPFPVTSVESFINRAKIGPLVPGETVLVVGVLYIACWIGLAVWVGRRDAKRARERGGLPTMG